MPSVSSPRISISSRHLSRIGGTRGDQGSKSTSLFAIKGSASKRFVFTFFGSERFLVVNCNLWVFRLCWLELDSRSSGSKSGLKAVVEIFFLPFFILILVDPRIIFFVGRVFVRQLNELILLIFLIGR